MTIMKSFRTQSYWRLLFFLMIIISMSLAGCKTSDPTPTEAVSEGSTPTAQPSATTDTPEVAVTQSTPVHLMVDEEDLAGIVVRFLHPWTGALADTIEDIAARFSMTNAWDIWVEVETPGGESAMLEALEENVAEGNVPGLIAAHPYEIALSDVNVFTINLSHYFENVDWGLSPEAREDIPPVFLDQFKSEGALVALPVAPQATVIFYNQTWGGELGYAYAPKDAAAFQEQSCEAVYANNEDDNVDNDGTGGWLVSFEPAVLASWYAAFDGDLPVDGMPSFDTEAGEAAFSTLKSTYDQGCIWIGRQPEPYFYFANRYALMYAGTLDQIPVQMGWMGEAENGDTWTAMGFPGPAGETMLIDGPGLMVTADSPENQMAAWLFARYLLEPEVQAELVRSGFTLPVRESAMDLLGEFSAAYPQWAQAVNMMDGVEPLPISRGWGVGRFLLQDAMDQFLHIVIDPASSISNELSSILEELDAEIIELEGMAP
jgi:multiple sugar transport system substrate-binding protein